MVVVMARPPPLPARRRASKVDHRAGLNVHRTLVGRDRDRARAGIFRDIDELLGDAVGDEGSRTGDGNITCACFEADVSSDRLNRSRYAHRCSLQRDRTAERV